jgi:hypothetical protein
MGRNAKRAKQARRDKQRREDARRRGPSVTVHEVRTPDDLRATLAKMIATPKSGDWRPDVLGQNSLSMQPGPDGWPLINGHRVTREMCQALQAERPDQAGHFTYEDIVAMAQELGPPNFEIPEKVFETIGADGCSGIQLDHRHGSMSCSRGTDCPGVALTHHGWDKCDRFGPCAFCEGPPVTWACEPR